MQTATPIGIGTRGALTFPLPGLDGQIRVICRIVRTVDPETSRETRELRSPGMGVEFERFGRSGDRRAIDSYVHGQRMSVVIAATQPVGGPGVVPKPMTASQPHRTTQTCARSRF